MPVTKKAEQVFFALNIMGIFLLAQANPALISILPNKINVTLLSDITQLSIIDNYESVLYGSATIWFWSASSACSSHNNTRCIPIKLIYFVCISA